MNVYDSDRMAALMEPHGYQLSDEMQHADMVILNTCHIREKAAEKLYSELGRIRAIKNERKKQGNDTTIVVAGCVAQAEGEEVVRRAPIVDVVVGPQSYHTLPDLLAKVKRDKGHVIHLEFEDDKFDKLPESDAPQGPSAWLSVQEGCDKFCTFCVVPYTRGAEYSRPVPAIYREAMKLVAQGSKEITLLGQNVNAFHGEGPDGDSWSLGQLIQHLAKIDGLERIRYSTSHPRDMHPALYEAHGNEPKLMPFLNLPVQSGANNVLECMNRKHNRDDYFKIIDDLREKRPDMQFSSDFIVGFPGETDKDFEDTMDLVRRVGFTQAYSFKYSPRPGTPGAEIKEQVPEHIKDERLQELQKLLNTQQLDFNAQCVGRVLPVLLEKKGKHPGQLVGKTPFMQSVHITSESAKIGQIIDVTIDSAGPNSLSATP